jgi:Protein of unknown function (DUF2612)
MMNNPAFGVSGFGYGGFGNQPIETLLISYYLDLVTHFYAPPNAPQFNALLYVLLKKFDDVSQCLVQLDTAFDLDSAVGVQLDMLGQVAGASRTLPFQPSYGVSPVLDDATYRTYIKAKIAQNQWDGTIDSLYQIWASLFPGVRIVIADNQNMSATLFINGLPSSILIDMIAGYAVNGAFSGTVQNGLIVPRPEGVEYTFDLGDLPAFGFDISNAYVAGWDVGHWS